MGSFGVRSYLFALLGVSTALPVVSFGLSQAEHHAHEVSVRHDEALRSFANTTAHRVGAFFAARRQDLETLAAAVATTGTLGAESNRAILDAHFRISGAYVGTYLGTPDGTPVARATRQGSGSLETNYRDRDYFQEVTRTRRTAFSRVQIGKFLNEPSVQVATPIITRDGHFLGYAEGSLDLGQLEPFLLEALGDAGPEQLTLVDATGHIVVDSRSDTAPLTNVSQYALFEPPTAGSPLRTELSPAAVTMRGAVVEVPGMPGWRIVAAEPKSIIDTLEKQERRQVWWAAGIAGGAALFLSAALSTWLARRFRRLASQIKAAGSGAAEQSAVIPTRWEPREFQALQRELTLLDQELSAHRRGLEQKVESRTAELARTNERLHLLIHALERAEDGIAITNADGEFLYVNPALESITGYPATELLTKTALELQLDPTDESVLATRKADLTAGKSHRAAFAARRKDGTLFEQECTTWPIPDAHGQSSSHVTLRKDVTAQRRTEQSLRLSERMASLGILAAGVAHEINNPLTYVLLSLRLAQRQLDRNLPQLPKDYVARTEAALTNALDGAERVSEIVKDLRLFSRADETILEAVDPPAVLDSALRLMGNDMRLRARIECDYRPTPAVTGNHAKLHQVFLNLFINASHAIEEAYGPVDAEPPQSRQGDAQIRVTTDTDANGDCVIEISDTGVGIAPELLDRIFDPFFTTKPVGVGTGLGLAMCRSIIASMSGEITVRSELGCGTTFRIVLPRARVASAPPQTMQTQRRARMPKLKLLVVDDNRAIGESVAATLGDYHQVEIADNGHAALSELKRQSYDVILCDLRMPHMNGIELFRALQDAGRGDERRIIFFTGGHVSEATRNFLQRHKRPCVSKPISEEQLEKVVREVLQDLTAVVPARTAVDCRD